MTENNNNRMGTGFLTEAPEMEVDIKELKAFTFYYGKGMGEQWLRSGKKFLNYVGIKCGQSTKRSIDTIIF